MRQLETNLEWTAVGRAATALNTPLDSIFRPILST